MSDIVAWVAILLGAMALWGQVCLESVRRRDVALAVNDALWCAFFLYALGVFAYGLVS